MPSFNVRWGRMMRGFGKFDTSSDEWLKTGMKMPVYPEKVTP